ncbi:MAG: hypothetical protein LBF22_07850 [Deltaproteobacteria bacterium]|jgi:beta-N-acetylhexosaminidase|nr:hypothetical protein [Deltaproteobacteria bacterium]
MTQTSKPPQNISKKSQISAQIAPEDLGQLFLIGWESQNTSEILGLLREFRPAGFIFFKRNYPGSFLALREQIRTVNLEAKKLFPRKLLWAIDHEGGTVNRLPFPETLLPSAQDLGALACQSGVEILKKECFRVGTLLRELGFNLNLAPVLDVQSDPQAYIGTRSFSTDPSIVAKVARAFYEGFSLAKLLTCGKHFPGLGRARKDPHRELPVITQSVDDFWDFDGLPFRELIASGLPAIMTTHVLLSSLDDSLPVTYSSKALSLLKHDYGFQGLVITDDLEMGALNNIYSPGKSALEAFQAGHDLLLFGKTKSFIKEAHEALRKASSDFVLDPTRVAVGQ